MNWGESDLMNSYILYPYPISFIRFWLSGQICFFYGVSYQPGEPGYLFRLTDVVVSIISLRYGRQISQYHLTTRAHLYVKVKITGLNGLDIYGRN